MEKGHQQAGNKRREGHMELTVLSSRKFPAPTVLPDELLVVVVDHIRSRSYRLKKVRGGVKGGRGMRMETAETVGYPEAKGLLLPTDNLFSLPPPLRPETLLSNHDAVLSTRTLFSSDSSGVSFARLASFSASSVQNRNSRTEPFLQLLSCQHTPRIRSGILQCSSSSTRARCEYTHSDLC